MENVTKQTSTHEQLSRRVFIEGMYNCRCIFCNAATERSDHLLLDCNTSTSIWATVWFWFGAQPNHDNIGENGWNNFFNFYNVLKGKVGKGKEGSIWLATVWCLWNARNDIMFNNKVSNTDEIIHKIKMFSCGVCK